MTDHSGAMAMILILVLLVCFVLLSVAAREEPTVDWDDDES